MTTPWQLRYGNTRALRGERLHKSLGPLPVIGMRAGNELFLWSSIPKTTGIPGTLTFISGKQLKGHIETMPLARNLRVSVRSQRCTETDRAWYSNTLYEVTLELLRGRRVPVSCTCPDYEYRSDRFPACKHMIAVAARLQDPNPDPVLNTDATATNNTLAIKLRRSARRTKPPKIPTQEGYSFMNLRQIDN